MCLVPFEGQSDKSVSPPWGWGLRRREAVGGPGAQRDQQRPWLGSHLERARCSFVSLPSALVFTGCPGSWGRAPAGAVSQRCWGHWGSVRGELRPSLGPSQSTATGSRTERGMGKKDFGQKLPSGRQEMAGVGWAQSGLGYVPTACWAA